jgi:hypothetical protein
MRIDEAWIPIVAMVGFFWAVVAVTRAIADARVRGRLIETGASPELVKTLTARPVRTSDHAASLKWGIVLTTSAIAIMLVGYWGLEGETAGIGLAMLGAGLGLLIFYPLGQREQRRVEQQSVEVVRTS